MTVLEGLRKDFGTTLILATHDQALTDLATRRLLLSDGEVSQPGSD
jgi:ABC-type lipoprotein export system ATPase subunit